MIFGLSRSVFFAGLIAIAGAAGVLWYVLSEDERTAPVAQRESVATQETAPSQPQAQAPAEEAAPVEAEPEEIADAPSDAPATPMQAADDARAQEPDSDSSDSEEIAQDATAESDAAPATELEPMPEPEPEIVQPRLPAFGTIRVEPTGEAVIAGRDAPEGDVALLRDGEIYDETFAGPSGDFVFTPEPFPVGTSDVTLRATDRQGNVLASRESVTIIVDPDRTRMPMVALTAPGRPTEVLSRPEPVQIAEVAEVEEVAVQDASSEAVSQAPESRDTEAPADGAEAQVVADAPVSEAAGAASAGTTTPVPDATPTDEPGTAMAAIDPEDAVTEEPVDTRTGVRIVAVEAETGGGLFVSAEAEAQAAIRLYLNDTLVAQAEADDGGDVSFAIRRGVRAGRYQVRLDDVDPATGTVLSRAEVGFTVPEAVAAIPAPQPEPAPATTAQPAAESAAMPAAPPVAESDEPAPTGEEVARDVPETAEAMAEEIVTESDSARPEATVTVPELATALVERGDSLWRISRQVYGRGIRYTEIFEANQDQIRNPNLIYPGQVFVLPPDRDAEVEAGSTPAE